MNRPRATTSEVIVSLAEQGELRSAIAIRSTVLISSLAAIESLGASAQYFRELPSAYHPHIRELVAGQWLSMELGLAHYGAIEALNISEAHARKNGRHVAERVQNSHFATVVRALGDVVSPWAVLPRLPSFLARHVQGGGAAVYKLGPKDARIEFHAIPIARYAYVRRGWAGMIESTLSLLTRTVQVNEVSSDPRQGIARWNVSWV